MGPDCYASCAAEPAGPQHRGGTVPTIRFNYHPAYIRLSDGLSVALRYWRASWTLWILPVVAIVVVNGLAAVVFGSTTFDARSLGMGGAFGRAYTMPTLTPALIAGPLATMLVSLVAGWYITAVAVAGLRGRAITVPWVVSAGLGTMAAALLGVVAMLGVVAVCVIAAAISPLLLIVGLFMAVPASIYVSLRVTFWTIAIFDGHGVIEGLRFSWLITQGSVLRLLGWGLVAAAISLGLMLVAAMAALVLAQTGSQAPGDVVLSGVTATFQAFTVILMAVLYESQRWRFAPPAVPAVQASPTPDAEMRSPLEPPPPPTQPWG